MRAREIVTLRAVGYGALTVAVSVLAEAVLLSVTGALIGAAIAWAFYDGQEDSFGMTVFHLRISSTLVGVGICWAVAVALFGGILPSIRTARRPVADALRAA